jgi:cell division protein FtsB
MSALAALSSRARAAVLPALLLLAAGYFLYHAIGGERGVLAYPGYVQQREQLRAQNAALDEQKAALEAKRRLLDPRLNKDRIIDEDYVDELARRELGLVKPGDLVLKLPPLEEPAPASK